MYDNNNKGAVWLRKSKNNMTYMSGKCIVNGQEMQVSIFKNKKNAENHPDYNLVFQTPYNQNIAQQNTKTVNNVFNNQNDNFNQYRQDNQQIRANNNMPDDSDIPF